MRSTRTGEQPTGTLEQLSWTIEQLAASARVIEEHMPKILAALASSSSRPAPLPSGRGTGLPHVHADAKGEKKVERLCYRLGELAKALGMSADYLREEVRAGRLRARKVSNKVLIPAAEAAAWFDSFPSYTESAEPTSGGKDGENAGNA
jgi:excisionase family DNA binding protein